MMFPDSVDDKLLVDGFNLRTTEDYTLEAVNGSEINFIGDVRANGSPLLTEEDIPGFTPQVFNVRHYGAVGNGIVDDTVAVRAAATAAKNSATAPTTEPNDGRLPVRGVLYFPSGDYLITESDAIIINDGYRLGLTIKGDSRLSSRIRFVPSSAAYLIKNGTAGATGGWMHLTFEDLGFSLENANASFMLTTSTGGERDYVFNRVSWSGNSTSCYGFRNTGADNYDTLTFSHCSVFGNWNTFFWVEGSNDQQLCHTFYDHTFEVINGNFARLTSGGHLHVYGGSFVVVTSGLLFDLEGASHSSGACYLAVRDTRVELRTTSCRLLESEWTFGTIIMDGVDESAMAPTLDPTHITSTIRTTHSFPTIAWKNCSLIGRHKYVPTDLSYLYRSRISYESCNILDYVTADEFVALDVSLITYGYGGMPVIPFRNCVGGAVGNLGVLPDTELFWNLANRGEVSRKFLTIKNVFRQNPNSAGHEEFVLPMNAVIVGVRFYAPATGWVTGTGLSSWSLTLQTTEGVPTVIYTASNGAVPHLGINIVSDTLFFPCDTSQKRTLRLVSNAALSDYNSTMVCLIEYIG